jgi:hypothetical protein
MTAGKTHAPPTFVIPGTAALYAVVTRNPAFIQMPRHTWIPGSIAMKLAMAPE